MMYAGAVHHPDLWAADTRPGGAQYDHVVKWGHDPWDPPSTWCPGPDIALRLLIQTD